MRVGTNLFPVVAQRIALGMPITSAGLRRETGMQVYLDDQAIDPEDEQHGQQVLQGSCMMSFKDEGGMVVALDPSPVKRNLKVVQVGSPENNLASRGRN